MTTDVLIDGPALIKFLILGISMVLTASLADAKPAVTPADAYDRLVNSPHVKKNPKGEQFCWDAAFGMDVFIRNFKDSGDTSWLDWGVKYYDFLVGNMDRGPDGYRGWIGPQQNTDTRWSDGQVGDAVLTGRILEFSALVLKDQPRLAAAYGGKARDYVEMARKDVVEKWDRRGTWHEDGPYGAYVSLNKYLKPGNLKAWVQEEQPGISLPINMQNDMGEVCLLLYRITGDEFYRARAEKIFFRMKSSFQFFDDHYVWNYWEPFGPWDIDTTKNVPRHWVNVHGYRNYQAGEIQQIVAAYHGGVVFDPTDIQRLINTNLKVMWNQDREHPKFVNANNPHAPRSSDQVPAGREQLAGTLWTGLADFSPTIRALHNRLAGRPADPADTLADFTRRYVSGPVTVPVVEFTECRNINLAVVLPGVFKKGEKALVVNKAWRAGEMAIDLYRSDGKQVVAPLFKGPVPGDPDGLKGFFILPWDGTDPAHRQEFSGNYRVRWTMGQDFRERPVTILGNE